jgi:hypothetical protein
MRATGLLDNFVPADFLTSQRITAWFPRPPRDKIQGFLHSRSGLAPMLRMHADHAGP